MPVGTFCVPAFDFGEQMFIALIFRLGSAQQFPLSQSYFLPVTQLPHCNEDDTLPQLAFTEAPSSSARHCLSQGA